MQNLKNIKIAIGVDHRGFELKSFLIQQKTLGNYNIEWLDVGTNSPERTDYPIYAKKVVDAMLNNQVSYGVLACATGIGMAIAANRYKRIYAGVAWSGQTGKLAKEDDNVNVLVLASDYVTFSQSIEILTAWLDAKFKEDRYRLRLEMIDR